MTIYTHSIGQQQKQSDVPTKAQRKMPKDVNRSLTRHLRHNPNGLPMDEGGYVTVSAIKGLGILFEALTVEDLRQIVAKDAKNRYHMIETEPVRIRANQGHSDSVGVRLDDGKLFTPITPRMVSTYHATTQEAWAKIHKEGLNPMNRTHVHMAKTPNAEAGIRTTKGVDVILVIDIKQAVTDGVKFYESMNGVILTRATIDPKYIGVYSSE
jgi:RNA:NAD 2'-phosphotransferase (TPT1/KptA family)